MTERQLKGIGVSPGIAVGPAVVVRWALPEVPHRVVPRTQVEKEIRRLRAAIKDVKRVATLTNSAAGRTCMPSGFTIRASRSITAIPSP